MTKRIKEDHKRFRDVVSGKTRKELRRLIKSGGIVKTRPKGGKVTITIPKIEQPHFVHGNNETGLGRGEGDPGDVVGRDPKPGQGKGAGDQAGEGIQIQVDLEEVMAFMQDELKLPRMKPKANQVFEEVKIKYNDISKTGPDSLRHNRRTMREALKRLAMTNKLDNLHMVPGSKVPIKLIELINSDRRYRQYKEIRIPSSNAVIMFARDCSASMDAFRCDIVSDMSWWIDCWIRKFYKKVQRCYFVHDTRCQEVNEDQFYTYRYGGGTMCSSAFRAMADQIQNRFPPEKHNIYIFYFSDGDNWHDDNGKMIEIIREELGPDKINLIGMTQVCSWRYENSVKESLDKALSDGLLDKSYFNTTTVGPENADDEEDDDDPMFGFGNWGYSPTMDEDERNEQIIDAIRTILSTPETALGDVAA